MIRVLAAVTALHAIVLWLLLHEPPRSAAPARPREAMLLVVPTRPIQPPAAAPPDTAATAPRPPARPSPRRAAPQPLPAAGPGNAEAAPRPLPAAAAGESPALRLDLPRTRGTEAAIPSLAERARRQLAPMQGAQEPSSLANAIRSAAHGNCLHGGEGGHPGSSRGLLNLPFLAHDALAGRCAR
ncbi:hypothetical protein [Xylophilus sp.]|uniref:hypothetical protein n=1 Tax=Xylophilus sp. TaxID=2653893 RepID=UPI002D8068AD|nr:hypothetical protein [Xylophilus sp.]